MIPQPATNIRSDIRTIVLEPIEGQGILSSKGMVDNRLFKGEQELYAIKDPQNCMWSLKYANGGVPPVFKQQFTSFSKLLAFVTGYFERRGVRVTEVID